MRLRIMLVDSCVNHPRRTVKDDFVDHRGDSPLLFVNYLEVLDRREPGHRYDLEVHPIDEPRSFDFTDEEDEMLGLRPPLSEEIGFWRSLGALVAIAGSVTPEHNLGFAQGVAQHVEQYVKQWLPSNLSAD